METTEQVNIDTTENYYDDDYYYDYEDYDRGINNFKWTKTLCIIPVCFLGLAANTVSVWVWNAQRKNNIMVLLFQCLGVADNLFLLLTALRCILVLENQYPDDADYYAVPLIHFSQSLSIHVTVMVAVFSWLGVARPQLMQRVTHRHIILTCVGLAVWSALLAGLVMVMGEQFDPHQHEYLAMVLSLQTVTFFLPNLVLLGFSIKLLIIICQRQRQLSTEKQRRTTLAVLGIAGCSLLSCIMNETGNLLSLWPGENGCNHTCFYTMFGVGMLSQVLNSSINFVFYFFVASKFRPLLLKTMCCCSDRIRDTLRRFSTSSSIQVTTDSNYTTFHQQENKREPTEDLTETSASEQQSSSVDVTTSL